MIRVFIGYDPKEAAAFTVCNHSIQVRASEPVSMTPIMLSQLKKIFNRPRNPLQSTDFSFSRFLVPYLCNYKGWAIFVDGDMLVLDDIAGLWDLRDESYAIQVVKHHHVPQESTKFLNAVQTRYDKKNWSSVMLFNNAKCRALTPEYINTASGLELHQFKWLENDDLIGEIPRRWNLLVDYDEHMANPSLVHYTKGGPYFNEYIDCDYSQEWFEEQESSLSACQREDTIIAS